MEEVSKDVGRAPSGQALAVPAKPASGLDAARFDPSRIQVALERRIATYSLKQRLSDPFADDDCNKHDRYAFAVECFEVFAAEAGLEIPPFIYATDQSERTGE